MQWNNEKTVFFGNNFEMIMLDPLYLVALIVYFIFINFKMTYESQNAAKCYYSISILILVIWVKKIQNRWLMEFDQWYRHIHSSIKYIFNVPSITFKSKSKNRMPNKAENVIFFCFSCCYCFDCAIMAV